MSWFGFFGLLAAGRGDALGCLANLFLSHQHQKQQMHDDIIQLQEQRRIDMLNEEKCLQARIERQRRAENELQRDQQNLGIAKSKEKSNKNIFGRFIVTNVWFQVLTIEDTAEFLKFSFGIENFDGYEQENGDISLPDLINRWNEVHSNPDNHSEELCIPDRIDPNNITDSDLGIMLLYWEYTDHFKGIMRRYKKLLNFLLSKDGDFPDYCIQTLHLSHMIVRK